MKTLRKFWKDEAGLEAVEYAVIASLVVIGLVLLIAGFKDKIAGVFNAIGDEIDTAQGS
jgi:Flp pilus assembly pilin Flp